MHRRDPAPSPLSARNTPREERPSTPSSSIAPHHPPSPSRPTTPPPRLPAPTLQELGLALSVVTPDLSPSHFSAPPWSGTFLEPHYLLLCHAQGLDVLPLVSPPAQQPYALVRRVCFKSVVVMEQRGVLVAIAGRRDGVRVYALEDVKKAVQWRIDFEARRDHERMRREAAKRVSPPLSESGTKPHNPSEKKARSRLSTPSSVVAKRLGRKSSLGVSTSVPPTPSVKKVMPPAPPEPSGCPPPYVGPSNANRPSNDSAAIIYQSRTRSPSVTDVLSGAASIHRHVNRDELSPLVADVKDDWHEGSSDEEAINIVAAGASGSQALDERTSTLLSSPPTIPATIPIEARPSLSPTQTSLASRRNRPANLDLSLSRTNTSPVAPPSPTPTLITLRQALSQYPGHVQAQGHDPDTPPADIEDEEEEEGGISLVQALLESRLPDIPPMGTRRPQQAILITPTFAVEDILLPRSHTSGSVSGQCGTQGTETSRRRRRRWSVLDGMLSNDASQQSLNSAPPSQLSVSTAVDRPIHRLFRSHSNRSRTSSSIVATSTTPTPTLEDRLGTPDGTAVLPPPPATSEPVVTPSRSRFIPRIISNALHTRRSDEHSQTLSLKSADNDGPKSATAPTHPTPPPKLEYVKLPGTKGALLVKAVETSKKRLGHAVYH